MSEGKGRNVLEKATAAKKDNGKTKDEGPESDKEDAETAPSEEVEPQEAGCEVTSLDKQSLMLMPYYKGLPPLS